MGGVSGGVHISLRAFVRSVARRQGGSAWEGAMASHALVASHATAAALLGCNHHRRRVSVARWHRCVVVASSSGGDPAGRRRGDGSLEASTSSASTPSPSRARKNRAAASKPRNAIATGSGEWDSDDDASVPSAGPQPPARAPADRAATTRPPKAKPRAKARDSPSEDTELVMVLERRGEGWSEEVFPHVVMKRRPVERKARPAAKAAKADTAELYLEERLGFSRDDAVATISAAAAWRVTPRGRALVDKKIMRAVQSNTRDAIECMRQVGASEEDIPKLIRDTPQILAIVPCNEWNRRLLEYVVRTKVPGGGRLGPLKLSNRGRLPKEENRKGEAMKPWVNEVRELRRFGRLTQEQMYMLDVAGFDANVKETKRIGESRRTWEMWFDELVEYQCKQGTVNIPEERADAGLGLWLKRQKEKHREGKLGTKALKRLVAVGVDFEGYYPQSPIKPKRGRPPKNAAHASSSETNAATNAGAPRDERGEGLASNDGGSDSAVAPGLARESERTNDWCRVLGPNAVEYVHELRRWQSVEGEFIEPPLGSPLAVWLARVRARAADDAEDPLPDEEREALADAGIELENFSPVWLGELEKFYGLKQHRVTLHDPVAQRAFVQEQRQLAAEGKLSTAKLRRLKAAGVSGISGALQLDFLTLDSIDELEDEEFAPWPTAASRSEDPDDLVQSLMRENVVAAAAAAAARAEAERTRQTPRARRAPAARARRRPMAPIAPGPSGVKKEEGLGSVDEDDEEEVEEEEEVVAADPPEFERART